MTPEQRERLKEVMARAIKDNFTIAGVEISEASARLLASAMIPAAERAGWEWRRKT